MEPIDLVAVDPDKPNEPSSDWRRRVVIGVVAFGVTAVVVAIVSRWWRSGGLRRAVKELAEEGAVALADVIVDEMLPAA